MVTQTQCNAHFIGCFVNQITVASNEDPSRNTKLQQQPCPPTPPPAAQDSTTASGLVKKRNQKQLWKYQLWRIQMMQKYWELPIPTNWQQWYIECQLARCGLRPWQAYATVSHFACRKPLFATPTRINLHTMSLIQDERRGLDNCYIKRKME